MRDLIKKILKEELGKKQVIIEATNAGHWCKNKGFNQPEYEFCVAAENYIKNELEDFIPIGKKKARKKVFSEFESGLSKFFNNNKDNKELKNKLIQIENSSEIFIEGKKEIDDANKLLESNCSKFKKVTDKKLNEFDEKVMLYFLNDGKYSIENRLPTNYSALSVLFTKFFSHKGAFDGVTVGVNHNWSEIAKNWINHSFHPNSNFIDIRPEEEKDHKLTSLNFQELARIYFTNDIVFNSNDIRNSVYQVLDGVRQKGFGSEDLYEKEKFKNVNLEYVRYAKDYGFVDMYSGVDFIYKESENFWVPVQVKSSPQEATWLINSLGCKKYVVEERIGKTFQTKTVEKGGFN